MTIVVEVGLLAGAEIPGDYLRIGNATLGLIGTGKIAGGDVLADYSSRTMSFAVQRTSTRQIGPAIEYNAGTATVTLLNDDGELDPANMMEVAPGAVLRIAKSFGGITYPVFYGYIDSWIPEHRYPTHAAVTVTATDGMSRLAGFRRSPVASPVGAGETTGGRIARILDSVGWPGNLRDIDAGNSVLQATTLDGDALDEAQEAAVAEFGEFYMRADGVAYFRSRNNISAEARSHTSQGTFGSDRSEGELPYIGTPDLSYDRTSLVNSITAVRVDGVEQYTEDTNSIGRYGDYPHQQTDMMLTTDDEVMAWAVYALRHVSTPELRFNDLTLDGRLFPSQMMPQLLGRELGDRITVVRRPPPGNFQDSRELIIRSIEHQFSPPDKWLTTWGLGATNATATFIIGSATLGVIGTNAIGY